MAQRYSEHRMLTLIYKHMNEALGMLLHTILMRIPRTNRTDVETPRASFGSFTKIAQADACLLVSYLIKVVRPKDAYKHPFRMGWLEMRITSASASTFATAPTASPAVPARSSSSRRRGVKLKNDTCAAYLPHHKVRNADGPYVCRPSPSILLADLDTDPSHLVFAARPTARRRDDDVFPDAFVARAADSKASVRGGNMKERYICTVVDEIGVLLLVLDGHDPAGPNNQLAGEEVRRFEAEDKWLVFVPSIIGMRCGTSAPTMPFRSVGSHQRTIRFLSSALEFSFSFIQPSVTAERRRLPNVGKASLINTLKRRQAEDPKNVHNLPTFNKTPEFTKGLTPSTGHLKVGLLPVLLSPSAYSRLLVTSPGELNLDHLQSSLLVYAYQRLINDVNSELQA
ncbi:hypothetical protein EDB86DRAFT_3079604 [Lactarius hatsudake]|nr:hypothetical protein EDB86DRAFT_3079604 [Lactarius hatsudake]